MIRSKYREYLILFLIFLGVGFIIHLAAFPDEAMMADGVLNEIWRASNKWECAQGRWLLPVLDMINHNLVISYVVTPVTIILTAVTALATLDIFKIYSKAAGFRKNPAVWLMGGGGIIGSLIMANPTVAQLLTDSFIATHYAFAMLLSTGAVWILVQNVTGLPSRRRCLLSIIIITISLGIYQAYFAVTAFLLVSILIMDLLNGSASLDVVKKGFTYLLVLAGGMILYLIVTQLIFLFLNIEWAQYRDMGDLGHIGLGRWLGRVKDSLGFFWQAYFTGYIFNVTWWKWKGLFALIFAFFGIVLLHWSWGRIKSGRYLDVLLMGGLLICLFLGYGSIHLMTETGTGPLLTPQLMLPFVLIGCVFLRYDLSFDARKLLKKSMLGLSVILLYQMVLYDGAYYKVLKLTYDKTLTVGNKIMDGLSELEGYSQKETPVLILGNAIKENDFLDSEKAIWEAMRGSHTQYTIIHYVNAVGGQACWQFLLAHHLGFTIRTAPAETAYMIVNSEEFKAMPSDQNGEFIQMFENPNGDGTQVAVVKLGDLTYFE